MKDLTKGKISTLILGFAIPVFLGNLLQLTYSLADTRIVGSFLGERSLAAVGATTTISNLIVGFLLGLANGFAIITAQKFGAGDKKRVRRSFAIALVLGVIVSAILILIGTVFINPILRFLNVPGKLFIEAKQYILIIIIGLWVTMFYDILMAVMRAIGDTLTPLLILAISVGLNIVLDLLFIPVLKMGIAGAAIATDISQVLSAVLCMLYLMRVDESYKVALRKIRIHKEVAVRIIQVGVPTAIQNTVISFANVLVQSSVNSYGALAMAGFAAYIKIDGFNILPVMSFSMAATTFAGQNYGAGNIDRVRKGMNVTVAMGVIYCLCIGGILLLFSHPIIGVFSKDPTGIEYGVRAMWYFCPFYFMLAIMHGLAGAIRGIGKSVPPMVIILISLCVYRVVWIQLAVPHIPTIDGVYMVYPISWLIGAILMIIYTKKAFPKQVSAEI